MILNSTKYIHRHRLYIMLEKTGDETDIVHKTVYPNSELMADAPHTKLNKMKTYSGKNDLQKDGKSAQKTRDSLTAKQYMCVHDNTSTSSKKMKGKLDVDNMRWLRRNR